MSADRLTYAPAGAVDPAAGLATGREAPDVYATVFQDAAGIDAGEALRRGITLAREVDRMLADMYAMFGIADPVAVVGIVNTLTLSVIERRREIGVLRSVGASRRLVQAMIRRESLVLSLFGGSLGVVLGLLVGAVTQQAMLGQRLRDATVPTGIVLAVAAAAVVVGVLAAA